MVFAASLAYFSISLSKVIKLLCPFFVSMKNQMKLLKIYLFVLYALILANLS